VIEKGGREGTERRGVRKRRRRRSEDEWPSGVPGLVIG